MVLNWLTLLSANTFALTSQSLTGGFGWFAFSDFHLLPLFEVTSRSFRVRSEHAREIFFAEDTEGMHSPRVSRYRKVIAFAPRSRCPFRLVLEQASLGFSLEFRDGVRLVGSGDAPILSWSEGSVGVGVPTPAVPWVLLTWREAQPPILLSLSGEPSAWIARKEGPSFVVETVEGYKGWVRVLAPFGTEEMGTATARDLGVLLRTLKPHLPKLLAGAPNLLDATVTPSEEGFTVVWRFDKPGALIPLPLLLREGGVPAELLTPMEAGTLEKKPQYFVSRDSEVKVRFSALRLFPGRPVVQGPSGVAETLATLSHIDPPSVCEGALAYLAGIADEVLVRALKTALSAFMKEQPEEREPRTGLRFYFSRDGKGARLASAHALNEMALTGESEGLLGLLGSLDWLTWLPMGVDEREKWEAGAIVSLAASLSDSWEVRALGAMANMGAMGYGLRVGREDSSSAVWGPLWEVRSRVYPPLKKAGRSSSVKWWETLRYPVRCLTPEVACWGEGRDVLVVGSGVSSRVIEVRFRSPYPLTVVGRANASVESVRSSEGDYVFVVRPEGERFRLRLRLPLEAPLPPASEGGPRYNEALR